jgi:hypothetical protein
MANGLIPIPIAFDVITMVIESSAAVAMRQDIGILILKRFLSHQMIPLRIYRNSSSRFDAPNVGAEAKV